MLTNKGLPKTMKYLIVSIFSLIYAFSTTNAVAQSADEALLVVTHGDSLITYNLSELEALGTTTIQTSTIWTEGVQEFTGVSLAVLARDFNFNEGVFLASAINDYTVEVPATDAVENGPIIAFRQNGALMSIRDKGPLWLIYPYDSNPEYQSETVYSRSIWQLDRIETRD